MQDFGNSCTDGKGDSLQALYMSHIACSEPTANYMTPHYVPKALCIIGFDHVYMAFDALYKPFLSLYMCQWRTLGVWVRGGTGLIITDQAEGLMWRSSQPDQSGGGLEGGVHHSRLAKNEKWCSHWWYPMNVCYSEPPVILPRGDTSLKFLTTVDLYISLLNW